MVNENPSHEIVFGKPVRRVAGIRPVVYISSPYTKGDVATNTLFQCRIFDRLMRDRLVLPIAPLWSHFQHALFPLVYEEWLQYDLEMLPRYDACLRLDATLPGSYYHQHDSSGADREVVEFGRLGKPVFYSIEDLYEWVTKNEDLYEH